MKKHFLTGIVILLPIAITAAVIRYLVNFFTDPFVDFVTSLLKNLNLMQRSGILTHEKMILYVSKFVILICLFVAIIILGVIARWFLINWIVNLGDKLLRKIPLVSSVYKTVKQIIKSIFTSENPAFKRVVLVPFPQKESYVLGLIAGDAPMVCSKATNTSLVSVLIPTTPSPISGFVVMYKPEEIILLDMKPEDAIKYIISCGALTPDQRSLK